MIVFSFINNDNEEKEIEFTFKEISEHLEKIAYKKLANSFCNSKDAEDYSLSTVYDKIDLKEQKEE